MAHTIETKITGSDSAAAKSLRAFGNVRRVVNKCLHVLMIWKERSEQRHALGELNERMLKDIGVSTVDAYKEARKPFWLP